MNTEDRLMNAQELDAAAPLSEAERQDFFRSIEGVARASVAQLRAAPDGRAVVHWMVNVHRNLEAVTQRHQQSGAPIACKKGCGHCCHIRVEVLPAEIFRIAHHVRKLPMDAQENLIQALQRHVPGTQQTCPMLSDEQLCSIYEVRPSVCRKGHSLDVQACQDRSPTIAQSLALLVDAEALIQGTSQAYAQLGLQSGAYELTQALLTALHDSMAESRWLKGEAVFQSDKASGTTAM